MKIKDLAFVLVRLLALYVFVQGIGQLANLSQLLYLRGFEGSFFSSSISQFVLTVIVIAVAYFLLGWLLWSRGDRLANRLVGDLSPAEESSANAVPMRKWYSLGLTLVGIVLVAQNLPNLIGHIAQLIEYATDELPSAFASARRQTWIALSADLAKLAIAFVLIFRADGITGLIRKIRELGVKDGRQTEL